MADVLWNAFELSVNLIESIIIINFICKFLKNDFKSIKGKCVFGIGVFIDFCCVTVLNRLIVYEGVLGIAYIIEYFLFAAIFLKGDIQKKLFVSVIPPVVIISVNVLVSSIISSAFGDELQLIYREHSIQRVLLMVFVQIIIVCVFDLILKYSIVTLKKNEWRIILSVLGISFVSLAFIHIALINLNMDNNYIKLIMLSELGIIVLNIVSFYMTYSLNKSNSEAEELRIKNQQEEYRISYAENIKNQYEEIRRMRHDMKQDLAVISELNREQQYDEARSFADKVSKNLAKFDNVVDVQNVFINAILNSKLSTALEYGIKVICSSSNNVSGIDDIDLCNLLGNMLDNAIEAAKMCEMGYIEVSINSDENKILVIIANSIVTSVLNSNIELISTKVDSARHGYGIKTIRSIANKYNGTAKFYEESNLFYCQVLMYKSVNAKLT